LTTAFIILRYEKIFYGRSEEELMEVLTTKSTTINLKELGLNDRQIAALTLIVNNDDSFSINEYIEYFNVSRATASKDLNILLKQGLVSKDHPKYNKKTAFFRRNN